MRLKVLAASFALSLFAIFCSAQIPSRRDATAQMFNATRDAAAVSVAQEAISAMGGTAAIGQINDCVAQGTMIRTLESNSPNVFVWKNSGREFRYESEGRPVTFSGHGKPGLISGGTTTRLLANSTISNFPAHLAALKLLERLTDARYGFAALEDGQAVGRPATRIRTWLKGTDLIQTLTTQVWFIDKASGLPLRIEYNPPQSHNANVHNMIAIELSDWRPVAGVLVPFRIKSYYKGTELISDAAISNVSFNTGISASEFDGGVQ